MATKKEVTTNTLESAQAEMSKALAAAGEGSVAAAKRGEALKRATETLLGFENGADAVLLVVKPFVGAFMEANPRPEKHASFKMRRDDPTCVQWDRTIKLRVFNPLIQVNSALATAKVGKAVRCNMQGEVTLEEVSTEAKAATVKGLAGLLARLPYSATVEIEVEAAVKQWIAAGKDAIAKASAAAPAPVQAELSEFEQFKMWKAAQGAK